MKQIEMESLRAWLEQGRGVTVLDVRTTEDRAQWFIPGSIHVNAYAALKAGSADALAGLDLPRNGPIVTVCNAGKMSQIAADQLSARGYEALSLAGGMKAWSLAWNTAEVDLDDTATTVLQVRRTGKGCLSYMVASESDAAVIDASLDPEIYLAIAHQRRWRIRYALDTHIHADHLSRSKLLAQAAGAELLLPAQNRVRFSFTPLHNGQAIQLGRTCLVAIATPGHTSESTCYHLDDTLLFSGDTLFVSGVGRPDLHASAEEAGERARLLYASLGRLQELAPETLVLPGHASEPTPFDGKPVSTTLGETLTRVSGWLSSEDGFVRVLLAKIPPTPPNYDRIVQLNEAGVLPQDDPADLEAGANRCAVS